MSFLSDIMLKALNFFYSFSGNYSLAIIFLTIAINLALYPLTLQSIVQMSAMQRIQPKMKDLQEKYKDDPKTLQQEMMGMYKAEKVNPFGGCLPMLLKIPFFIAFFWVLQGKEFQAILTQPGIQSSFLWISNLAKPDPIYIMPGLVAISTFLSQKTMPNMSADNSQMKGMTYFMPLFIAIISISFAAGVQIYWVVSNLITMAQQVYVTRKKAV
ncbi:MAG: YidC/Oxa1 family membrane protein insertase [Candidatus Margulisiibacteriota bacterium]|nr:YidC/Oxa1 family membrane protein insertase [Candidatus Margulisiibacteriota bacterium]